MSKNKTSLKSLRLRKLLSLLSLTGSILVLLGPSGSFWVLLGKLLLTLLSLTQPYLALLLALLSLTGPHWALLSLI